MSAIEVAPWHAHRAVQTLRLNAGRSTSLRHPNLTLPLCRRYLVAVFGGANVEMVHEGAVIWRAATWSCAWSSRTECELVGLWLLPDASTASWQLVLRDLLVRGVEKIDVQVDGTGNVLGYGQSLPASENSRPLPSPVTLARRSLAGVARGERRALSSLLNDIASADSMSEGNAALDRLLASRLEKRYPALAHQWEAALKRLAPFYALPRSPRHLVRRASQQAERLSEALECAALRHRFLGLESASAYLRRSLYRAWDRTITRGTALNPPIRTRKYG